MKMKDLKKKRLKKSIILTALMFVVLGIGVGYAYLRDTLTIEDNAKMSMTWNVYFDNVQKVGNSIDPKTTPVINKTSFSTTLQFTDASQVYETKFDVKNEGSLNASVNSFTSNPLPTELQSYFDVSFTYNDGTNISNGNLISSNKTDSFRIRISLKNGVDISELPESIPVTVNVNYGKASQTDVERNIPVIKVLSGMKGNLKPGDQIKIGETEDFYVISSNSEKTVLLAKYNLMVGVNGNWNQIQIPTSTPGYGLQSVDALGYNDVMNVATVEFSSTNYWMNGNDLLSPYNENNTIYYDENGDWDKKFKYRSDNSVAYPYVYDSNSTIYGYINGNGGYVDKLKEMGAPSTITGRLLTYEEADAAQTIQDNGTSIMSNGQSYWLGSAYSFYGMWGVFSRTSSFGIGDYDIDLGFGVRPVIEISTSDI